MQAILITDPRTNFQFNLDRPKIAYTSAAETLSAGAAVGASNLFTNSNTFTLTTTFNSGLTVTAGKIKTPTIQVDRLLLSGEAAGTENDSVLMSGGTNNTKWTSVNLSLTNVKQSGADTKLKVSALGKESSIVVSYASTAGNTTNAANVGLKVETSATPITRYIPFADSNSSEGEYKPLKTNSSLQFNPSNGNVSATSFTATSSKTRKHEIKPIKFSSTELINKVNLVSFKYKPEIDKQQYQRYGFIAEETPQEFTADGMHMDYSNCIGLLLKAIQELDKRLSKLENK